MEIKTYNTVRIATTFIVAVIFSQSIIYKNYIIPAITLVIASLTLLILRRRVTSVIADERDYAIAGQSAMLALQIFSWVAVIAMFILYAQRDINPAYEPIAVTLAYATTFLMIMYSVIFKFHDKIKFSKNKITSWIIMGVITAVLVVFGIRLLSGEDTWICQNGQWIQHGEPNFPAPKSECK